MAFPTDEEVAAALLAGRHSAMSVRTAVAAHAAALQATVADLGGVLRHLQRAKREREWVRADQEAREAAAVEAAEVEAARAAPMTRELEAALSRARQVRADMESAGMVLDDDGDQPAAQVVARRGSRDPDTRTRTRTHTRTRTDRSSSRRGTQQRVGSRQQRGRGRGQDRYRGRDGRLGSGRGRGRGRGRGSIPQRVATGARTAHDESGAARGGSVRPRHPVAASPPHPHPHPHPDGRNSARPSPGPSPPPRSHASDRTPPPSARSTQASPRKLRVRTRLPARFRRLCLEWRQHVEDGAAAAVPPPSSSSPSPYAEVAAAAAGRAHTTRAASHAPTLLAARRRHVTAVERLFAHQSHLVEAPPPPPRTRTHHPDRRPGADSGAAAAAAAADGAASASRAPAMLVSLIHETQRLRREVQALSGAHAPPVPVQRWADVRAEAQALWDEAKEAPEAGGAKRTAGNKLLDVVYPHWRRMSEIVRKRKQLVALLSEARAAVAACKAGGIGAGLAAIERVAMSGAAMVTRHHDTHGTAESSSQRPGTGRLLLPASPDELDDQLAAWALAPPPWSPDTFSGPHNATRVVADIVQELDAVSVAPQAAPTVQHACVQSRLATLKARLLLRSYWRSLFFPILEQASRTASVDGTVSHAQRLACLAVWRGVFSCMACDGAWVPGFSRLLPVPHREPLDDSDCSGGSSP